MNRRVYILPVAFVLICGTLLFGMILRGQVKVLDSEKRPAQRFPDYQGSIEQFTEDFSSFANDQLLFRNFIVKTKSLISYNLFKDSPLPQQVIRGKEDWLFYKNENNITYYSGNHPFSSLELDSLTSLLVKKQQWLAQQGIEFYLFLPPSKPELYDEYLPDYLRRSEFQMSNTDQLINYLQENTTIRIVRPLEQLKMKKLERRVYMQYDSHWNTHGAFVAYQLLIDSIANQFPDVNKLELADIFYYPLKFGAFDLLTMCHLNNYIFLDNDIPIFQDSLEVSQHNGLKYPETSIYADEFYQTELDSAPSILMFRDSYAVSLVPYLSHSFSNSGFIWSPIVYKHVVEAEKPDIVVLEVVDRRISDLFIPMFQ